MDINENNRQESAGKTYIKMASGEEVSHCQHFSTSHLYVFPADFCLLIFIYIEFIVILSLLDEKKTPKQTSPT